MSNATKTEPTETRREFTKHELAALGRLPKGETCGCEKCKKAYRYYDARQKRAR